MASITHDPLCDSSRCGERGTGVWEEEEEGGDCTVFHPVMRASASSSSLTPSVLSSSHTQAPRSQEVERER